MIWLNYKVLILLALLFTVCLTQRGQGSRSRSRSSKSRKIGRKGSEQSSYYQILFYAAIFGGIKLIQYAYRKDWEKNKQQRKQKIENEFATYEGQYQSTPCSLEENQMKNLKDWFMQKKWTIFFRTDDGTFRDSANVTLSNIKERGRYSHNFQMNMVDSVGNSSSKGVLVHTGNYFSIMFEKTYQDRNQAGQTGTFDLLLYKGVQQGQVFRGKWYYKSHQDDNRYRGSWQMTHN